MTDCDTPPPKRQRSEAAAAPDQEAAAAAAAAAAPAAPAAPAAAALPIGQGLSGAPHPPRIDVRSVVALVSREFSKVTFRPDYAVTGDAWGPRGESALVRTWQIAPTLDTMPNSGARPRVATFWAVAAQQQPQQQLPQQPQFQQQLPQLPQFQQTQQQQTQQQQSLQAPRSVADVADVVHAARHAANRYRAERAGMGTLLAAVAMAALLRLEGAGVDLLCVDAYSVDRRVTRISFIIGCVASSDDARILLVGGAGGTGIPLHEPYTPPPGVWCPERAYKHAWLEVLLGVGSGVASDIPRIVDAAAAQFGFYGPATRGAAGEPLAAPPPGRVLTEGGATLRYHPQKIITSAATLAVFLTMLKERAALCDAAATAAADKLCAPAAAYLGPSGRGEAPRQRCTANVDEIDALTRAVDAALLVWLRDDADVARRFAVLAGLDRPVDARAEPGRGGAQPAASPAGTSFPPGGPG